MFLRTKFLFLLAVSPFALSPLAGLQSLFPSNPDKYSLAGKVVNSLTGEPIRGVLVQISIKGQMSALTGPDGKFQFDGLPSGGTTITVRKPGFFSDDELESQSPIPTRRLTGIGPGSSPVVLKLVPEGVIYGRIMGDDSEPIEGLPVQLVVQRLENGRKVWQDRHGASTDEDGAFRIAELQPGTYYLSAGPSWNPVPRSSQSGTLGFPIVYYPAGSDVSSASPIPLVPGKQVEINLTLSPETCYRVAGTITGYGPGQFANVQVLNPAGKHIASSQRFDPATGAFRIPCVPPGIYTLQAQAADGQGHALTSTFPLAVNSELSGIHVVLSPTVNIPIRIRVISSRTGSEPYAPQENYFPAYVMLVSRTLAEFGPRYGSQPVGERGSSSLELQNIAPGIYGVEVNPNGLFYVQSVTSGAANLLDSDLSVPAGGSPQPIEITLRDDAASLTGKVSLDNPPLNATILAFSEHASVPPILQSTDSSGAFQLPFIPPGQYKILAVDHPEELEYRNPEVMRKYFLQAQEITLFPGQTAKIELELVKVGE